MANQPIYQFYAELDEYKPRIWRRFQTAGNVTVARLGYILMTMFEMKASHLFAFEMPYARETGKETRYMTQPEPYAKVYRFEIPDEENFAANADNYVSFDAMRMKLARITKSPGLRLNFNYDFGDDWWVSLTLEDVFFNKDLDAKELPRVLRGEGYGIVEDCGGTTGLKELAKAFRRKRGREYREFRQWLGVDIDMSAFDIDDMNFRLKKVPRIYANCYEQHIYPTKRSIAILDRAYLRKESKNGNTGEA